MFFPDNKIVHWIAFALIFEGCARLHLFATRRAAVDKALAAEEAAKKAAQLRYDDPEYNGDLNWGKDPDWQKKSMEKIRRRWEEQAIEQKD